MANAIAQGAHAAAGAASPIVVAPTVSDAVTFEDETLRGPPLPPRGPNGGVVAPGGTVVRRRVPVGPNGPVPAAGAAPAGAAPAGAAPAGAAPAGGAATAPVAAAPAGGAGPAGPAIPVGPAVPAAPPAPVCECPIPPNGGGFFGRGKELMAAGCDCQNA